MAGTRPEHATGESIVQELNGRKPGDNLSDIAKDLTDAHAHRPGLFNQDLAQVTEKLHDQGILPGFDLVGVNGQDLIAKDASGKITVFDSTNLDRHRELTQTPSTEQLNGRDSTVNSDGSGQVTVKQGDSAWTISRDVLKSQGVDSPTNNQIANYIKELEQANGKDAIKHLQIGDQLKLPASTLAGDHTGFTSERARDNLADKNEDIASEVDKAKAALEAFHGRGLFGMANNISMEEINNALGRTDITADQREGLTFLRTHFDELKGQGPLGPLSNQDVIFAGSAFDQWQAKAEQEAALAALHAGL